MAARRLGWGRGREETVRRGQDVISQGMSPATLHLPTLLSVQWAFQIINPQNGWIHRLGHKSHSLIISPLNTATVADPELLVGGYLISKP